MRPSRLFLYCNLRKVLQYRVRSDGENSRHFLRVSTCRLQGTHRLAGGVQIALVFNWVESEPLRSQSPLKHSAEPRSSSYLDRPKERLRNNQVLFVAELKTQSGPAQNQSHLSNTPVK